MSNQHSQHQTAREAYDEKVSQIQRQIEQLTGGLDAFSQACIMGNKPLGWDEVGMLTGISKQLSNLVDFLYSADD